MRDQMLCVLLAAIAYGTSAGHCEGARAGLSTVTFQSATYNDMRQLMAREATSGAVTVKATLAFPETVYYLEPRRLGVVLHIRADVGGCCPAWARMNGKGGGEIGQG